MGLRLSEQARSFYARLVKAWHDDAIEVIAALPILKEIGEVLRRPRIKKKYRIQEDEIARYLELITAGAQALAGLHQDAISCESLYS